MRLKKKTGKKAGVLALTTALCLLTACGGSTAETVNQAEDSVAAETSQAEEGSENIAENAEAGGEMPEDMSEGLGQGSFYMGEIVSIEDMTITVNARGAGRNGRERMPEGERPESAVPQEGAEMTQPAQMPEGAGEAQTMVIEVTEDTVITIDGAAATIADLQEGDTIQFMMEDDVVISITAGEMSQLEKAE